MRNHFISCMACAPSFAILHSRIAAKESSIKCQTVARGTPRTSQLPVFCSRDPNKIFRGILDDLIERSCKVSTFGQSDIFWKRSTTFKFMKTTPFLLTIKKFTNCKHTRHSKSYMINLMVFT